MKDIVVRADRGRKKFEKILELAESIKRLGLIHPIIFKRNSEGKPVLIAGERRYRATISLGWKTIFGIEKSQADPLTQKELELEENIHRAGLDWTEEAELWRQIDEIKRERYGEKAPGSDPEAPGWTLQKTADLVAVPERTVRRHIKAAKALKANPQLKAQVAHLPLAVAMRKIEELKTTAKAQAAFDSGTVEVSANMLHGDATQLIKSITSDSIQLILTDPPFGITQITEDTGKTRGVNQSYTGLLKPTDNLDEESAAKLMDVIIPEFFRVLEPSGHLYIFTSFSIYDRVVRKLLSCGFELDWPPLIWNKVKTTSMFKGLSYSPQYEPIIFAHKVPRKKYLLAPSGNIINFSPVHASKKIHPFQKPYKLLKFLIEQSSRVGDQVLDPFAGSGETVRVAKKLNRSATGFELDQENWTKAQVRITFPKDSKLFDDEEDGK
jgi:DNA modification methylase